MNDRRPSPATPSKIMPVAIAGASLLTVAGVALFYYATVNRRAVAPENVTRIEIAADTCKPDVLELPAGRHTFQLHNASGRTAEWEILEGVMVVAEREHMVPGFDYTVTAMLNPGTYEIICGLIYNPRGKLTVTPSAAVQAAGGPELKAFIGPLSEYKVFLSIEGARLVSETQKLVDAIRRDDLAEARALYAPARTAYRKVEAVVSRWSDLQNAIDPAADYMEKREEAPAFTGFHRLEYGLFAQNNTQGLAPVADRLLADLGELKTRLRTVRLVPADLSDGVARLAHGLANGKVESGENIYAYSDLPDFDASLAGIAKTASLVRPLLATSDPGGLANELDDRIETVRNILEVLKNGGAYPAYSRISPTARADLAAAYRNLADTLDKVGVRLMLRQPL